MRHPGSRIIKAAPVLDWRAPVAFFVLIVFFAVPLALWTNASDPRLLQGFMVPWPVPWAEILAVLLVALLMGVPLLWVLTSRVLDLFAFFMAQNALLIAGYFFLGTTAWKIEGVGREILQGGSLVVLINAIGFGVLFSAMALTYLAARLTQARVPALHASPQEYDRRFTVFLRFAGLGVAFVLALPMARYGVIPMLAPDPAAARAVIASSDIERAFYNLGTALVPFVTGGLLLLITRQPLRVFGFDGMVAAAVMLIQLLSGNRFPLAIAFFVTITLVTVERRWPRPLLVVGFAAFMLLLTGVSGFTGMLRQNKAALDDGKNVVEQSLQQAFYGDNLIDARDAAWVLSQWDFDPLMGRTYLGGLASMIPSGIFPQKKQWHLGLTGVRIVGWDPDQHFGLRITFFGEAFLNFGVAGVVVLGALMGSLFGLLLRALHLIAAKRPPCLHYSLKTVMLMQMCMPLANTSDAFTFWAMAGFLFLQWIAVDLLILFKRDHQPAPIPAHLYAQGRP